MAPPEAGNQILIPLFDAETLGKPSTVQWSQNLSTRTADCYALLADNITTRERNPLFIAVELYQSSNTANPRHITRVGELVSGGKYLIFNQSLPSFIISIPFSSTLVSFRTHIYIYIEGYKLTIDSSFQYDQKNARGDLRFLVYHDKERRPYQHCFVGTALGSAVAGKTKQVAEALGKEDIANDVSAIAKNFVGDYLRNF